MLIWGISTEESLLARNLAVYLALFFLLTAFCGMNTTIVSLAVWMIGQSALYDLSLVFYCGRSLSFCKKHRPLK